MDYSYDPIYQLLNEMRTGINPYNTTSLNDPAGNRLQKIDSGAVTTGLFNSANELVLLTPPAGAPTTSLWDQNRNLSV